MRTILVLIAIQTVVLAGLIAGAWYWFHQKRAEQTAEPVTTRSTSPLRVIPAPSKHPKHPPLHDTERPIGELAPPDLPPEEIAPPPEDPGVPALVSKLRTAAPDTQVKLLQDLGDRGAAARRAVPALIDMLALNMHPLVLPAGADPVAEEERRESFILAILKAIEQIGVEDSLLPSLLTTMDGKDEDKAVAAVYVMGLAGEPAVDGLLARLTNKEPAVRFRALRALFYRHFLPDRVLQPVMARLTDENELVRQVAPGVLMRLGPRAAPAVPGLIQGVEAKRVLAAMALGAIGPEAKSAVPALRKALADQETVTTFIQNTDPALLGIQPNTPSLAAAAAAALERIGSAADPAVPDLVAALGNKRADARALAARALGRLGADTPAAADALAQRMRDEKENPAVRAEAIQALGRLGKSAVPVLVDALRSPNASLRAEATKSLGQMAPLPTDAMVSVSNLLHDPDPAVRMAAATLLGQSGAGGAAAVDDLAKALTAKGETPEVIGTVADSLARLGDRGCPVLIKGLKAPSAIVRRESARSLGTAVSPSAGTVSGLAGCLHDEDEGVRAAAAEGLSHLGGEAKSALPTLQALASKDPSETVRKIAAAAVMKIMEP